MTKYEFLEKLRKDLGYSRKKIAEYLNVSASAIEKYEKGKLDFNYKTKYILGICALAGYNNEIFKIENIDDNLIHEYKLSKFSQKLREILYFLDIDYDDYKHFIYKLIIKNLPLENLKEDTYFWEIDEYLLNVEKHFIEETLEYARNKDKFINNLVTAFENIPDIPKNQLKQDFEKEYEENVLKLMTQIRVQILFLFILNFFNVKEFYEEKLFKLVKISLENRDIFLEFFLKFAPVGVYNVFKVFQKDKDKLKKLFPIIKKTIEELEKNGKPVNKETIKEFKIELESGTLFAKCNTPTDPKDKQICELLQYAPPAFKDKIIEKLLQYKKDVEEF